jgi:predicted DNA repair protein MutK
MASGLLVLLDDIAMILDDVAAIAKVAVKRTAGILGDDLALKVEQLVGISILVAIESLKYFYSKWASK